MKKFWLFLVIMLALLILTGCQNSAQNTDGSATDDSTTLPVIEMANVWDNTIASDFARGNGTETSPFEIETVAQLAYLAQKVNSGTTYSNQYFMLVRDLDLNNIAWTPIGNGNVSFEGNFDGGGHSITNLKITEALKHTYAYSHMNSEWGLAGLFGTCQNATIKNINICKASISIGNLTEHNQTFLGILIARLDVTSNSLISNVNISNSTISTVQSTASTEPPEQDVTSFNMYIGGLIGYIQVAETATYTMDTVQGDINVDYKENFGYTNYTGSIIGYANNDSSFECSNFASYLTVQWPEQQEKNYVGAIGYTSNGDGHFQLSNAFSEIRVCSEPTSQDPYYSYETNAIIGHTGQAKNADNTVNGVYEFENLFGYVHSIEGSADFAPIHTLYLVPEHAAHTENNCEGSESLPDAHNLDSKIWNSDDFSRPVLIFKSN